jgi:DNA adenine methylase
MNSPLAWLGGKSRLAKKIVPMLPPHEHYGEPFAGAGWIFFRKAPSRVESLNDINSDLVSFYRVLQNHLEEFCRQFRWLLSSREIFEDFNRQRDAGGLTDIQRAARFYYVQRQAFGGKVYGQSFGVDRSSPPRINLLRIEEELSAVHLRLTGVTLENLPWHRYLEKYDGKETFFYLDPPYYGCESDYGKDIFTRDDFDRLAERLAKIQGKFLLSLNDTPEVRDIFGGFFVEGTTTRYTVNGANPRTVGEVLVMNYKPSAGLLDLIENKS